MPNLLAQVVLYSWPLVTWLLFRKLNLTQAIVATVLLGYLFIPERVGYDPPLLPPIDKATLPVLCAFIGAWLHQKHATQQAQRAARKATEAGAPTEPAPPPGRPARTPGSRISRLATLICAVLLVPVPILTWMTNQDPIIYGDRVLMGIAPYDIGGMALSTGTMLLPLLLARKYVRTREQQIDCLKVFAWSGFAYSFLMLWESRMSPQLNVHLYGFFAHDFIQHIRNGGFRPIVFLAHGLRVGIFITMAILAIATLARADVDGKRKRWLMMTAWLMGCLVLSHNLGATVIALLMVAVVLAFPLRLQFLLAALIAGLVMVYPIARGSGLIPAERILNIVSSYSEDRAGSLNVRLINEDALLARAQQKPLVGWGGWGRNRIYDDTSGRDESVTDGAWVMIIGTGGWLGYLCQFGLLCLPIIFSTLRYRRYRLDIVGAGLVLVLCANVIDLIPNSSTTVPLWLVAGTVWGRLELASISSIKDRLTGKKRAAGRKRTPPGRPQSEQPAT